MQKKGIVMKEEKGKGLQTYLSPAAVWALSIGTIIGWGSLVVTSSTYLADAGPAGSVLGMLAGLVITLFIGWNYHYMINCFPEAGGSYAFTREVFGYDHGFLTAWFLALTYLAVLWANATSLPLFSRYFLGGLFKFGYLYTILGYDVYIGEALLTFGSVLLVALLCMRLKRLTAGLMVFMAGFFTLGILVCSVSALIHPDHGFQPAYIPDKNEILQIMRIACISPWAYIGFESISHSTEEFSFPRKKVFRIMASALIVSTVLYILIILLSVTAYPPEYSTWLEYIQDHGNLEGIKGLPAFYAVNHYMGSTGVTILILSLLALILTSLVGNITALSRLFYSLGKDHILPHRFSSLNEQHVPSQALWLIVGLTAVIPFLGRTAIGWIVDVTTIGAVIIYGFVSASAGRMAALRGDRREKLTGLIGLAAMAIVGFYLLAPNLFSTATLATESYILFAFWAILGFLYFRRILQTDHSKRFGKSIIVWIVLLSLVLFIALVWMIQFTTEATNQTMTSIQEFYNMDDTVSEEAFIAQQRSALRASSMKSSVTVAVLFAISLSLLLSNFAIMTRRLQESEAELGNAINMANTDPLTGVKSKHAYAVKEQNMNALLAENTVEPFAVAVCDVNGLKQVNDTLGHKAGDEYIRSASRMICEIFMHSPVYRVGGDEFVVYLTGKDFERRQELMEQLHSQSEENIFTGNVVVAGGLADYRQGEDASVHDVFERADSRMYVRKKELKNMGAPAR